MDDNKFKDEFISTLSHEIRTPLTSIKGFSKTMLDNWDKLDDDNKKKFLNIIQEQSNRLINLVENILNVAKIDADTDIVLREVNLESLVKSSIELVKINYKEREFKFSSKKVSNSLADRDRLEQIFVNIIENACKYSTSKLPIEISTSPSGDFNVVSVKNYGSFISEKDIEHIFEKFYRADNYLTSCAQGSGLGLYIAKSLVEKMNGRIEIKSLERQQMTEFLIYIPVIEQEKMSMKIKGEKVV